MNDKKYYVCEVCGNVVEKVHDSGNELMCCMRTMQELMPGVTDGDVEFHIPVCTCKHGKVHVTIGEKDHPMDESHYIMWISVITDKGEMKRYFKPGEEPKACFRLSDDERVCAVYAYCNRHKLWKCDVEC